MSLTMLILTIYALGVLNIWLCVLEMDDFIPSRAALIIMAGLIWPVLLLLMIGSWLSTLFVLMHRRLRFRA